MGSSRRRFQRRVDDVFRDCEESEVYVNDCFRKPGDDSSKITDREEKKNKDYREKKKYRSKKRWMSASVNMLD